MKSNIKNYILEYYTGNEKNYHKICNDIYNTFKKELYNSEKDFQYFKNNEFNAFTEWMEGRPSVFDTDYYIRRSAVKDLNFILGEENKQYRIFDEENAKGAITTLIYLTVKQLLIEV